VSNEDPEVKTKCTNLAVIKVEENVLSTLEARMSNWHILRRLVATLLAWKRRKLIDIEALQQTEKSHHHDDTEQISDE